MLFKAPAEETNSELLPSTQDSVDRDYYATLPPVDQFMDVPVEQSRKRLFEILAIGDIVAGSIIAIKEFGMFIQVVCLYGKSTRYIQNCDVVGLLPKGELGDRYSQNAQLEDFLPRDIVRCAVIKTDAANEKVILTMKNETEENKECPLVSIQLTNWILWNGKFFYRDVIKMTK